MMEKIQSKYFMITPEKESNDIIKLSEGIKNDGWIDSNTVIVNCSPEYSSRLTQELNHRLSHLNKNELYEQVNLEMPYPNTNQVYDPQSHTYVLFDRYLKEWVNNQISNSYKYLFVSSATLRGKNFNKVRLSVKPFLDSENFMFVSLYMQSSSIFEPDFYVEKFDKEKQGGLLFHWENINNPNWDY